MSATQTTKPVKGNPASAQPMPNISARGLKLLAHRRPGFCTPIEPAGINHQRKALRKASI